MPRPVGHGEHRPVRECRPSLWRGRGNPVRRQLHVAVGPILFSDRGQRRRQDLAVAAALSVAAAQPGHHPPVRRGCGDPAARPAARLSAAHRGGVPGFPADPASVGRRQYRAALARRRDGGGRDRARGARDAGLDRPVRAGGRAARHPVGRRAAAGGDRARGHRAPRIAGRRRTDGQCRPGHGGAVAPPVQLAPPAGHHRGDGDA